ncbi:hypothetical protein CRENBAI_008644 [Crenichthys baileyi]|uniref:Uncharacterized protein n=1 Tax=Crenichthys baileyi TaxID=28760 RepID=A0AAV9RMP5_9TELE
MVVLLFRSGQLLRHHPNLGSWRAEVPPWSQAWGRDSPESAWWPGCSSWDPAGPSPNERREAIPQWAHHLQWVVDEGGDCGVPETQNN